MPSEPPPPTASSQATTRAWAIRPLTIGDYEAVVALWRATPGVGLNASDERPQFAAFLARNPGFSRAAWRAGMLVGAVLCGHDGRRASLIHLAVAESARRLGIGSALVEGCLAQLRTVGIQRCNILVYADNPLGQAFWASQGFRPRTELTFLQREVG